jgi:Ca2+-binding EF-hand superfamily protein
MEEFMYTYLNQKYGLKNMVIEWATNIINGIRTFSPGDTEISLFGKILQNELEESSQLLITNVKENINSIIMSALRAEYPFKSEIELKKIKKKYIKNEIPPELIQYIINASFDEKGKQIIFDKINKEIDNRRNIILNNSKINGKLSREEYNKIIEQKQIECNSLQYDFLIDICLEYQIRLHIKYLKPFIRLFKIIDSNRDGILDEEQFIDLIKKMNIFGEDIVQQMTEEFLNKLDPYGNKRITFSDIVDLFSQINFDQTQTIMDKYCINENGSGEINNKNSNIDKK